MTKKLKDFSVKRNWKEAIVFYLAYLLLGLLISFLIGAIFGIVNPEFTDEMAITLGKIVGTIYYIIIYFSIYIKKKMDSFKYILIGILSAILNVFTGLIFSLIFVAYLTTKDSEIETAEWKKLKRQRKLLFFMFKNNIYSFSLDMENIEKDYPYRYLFSINFFKFFSKDLSAFGFLFLALP